MNIQIELTGMSPLLMHNAQLADPDFEITRQIKVITNKRKKTDDDRRQVEKLEWYGGLYLSTGGSAPSVAMPSRNVRKCLIEAAKISKLGKALGRALSFSSFDSPLIYDGPANIDQLWEDRRFRCRLTVGVGQKKNTVIRVRPQFFPWTLKLQGIFVEDAGVNFDDIERIVDIAGIVEGLGDNRVNGFGRFTGRVVSS